MKYSAEDLEVNEHGLVAVECGISEAGLGLRKGEVRGVSPEVAAAMLNNGHAKLIDKKTVAKAADDAKAAEAKAAAEANAAELKAAKEAAAKAKAAAGP